MIDLTYEKRPESAEPLSAALGLFDGVHIGHRMVLERAAAFGGALPCCFTFPTGSAYFKNGEPIRYLCSEDEKRRKLQACGIEYIYSPTFESIRDLSPERFVHELLSETLHCRAVCCGEDFTFGKNAAGDAELLKKLCSENGIDCAVIPNLLYEGMPVSSGRIRNALYDGNVTLAAKLLGEPFELTAEVVHGLKNGRRFGFPTANQPFEACRVVPRYGVYASEALVKDRLFSSVTNIGVKPTISAALAAPLAETYIHGFDGELYGQVITVRLKRFLRGEQRFQNEAELIAQMTRDSAAAM